MGTAIKASLELGARHAEVVQSAIEHWVESNVISQSQASLLADTIVVRGFDWAKFAKYTLRLAILCLAVAVSSVIFEQRFVRLLKRLVELPPWVRGAATCVAAVATHVFAYQRTERLPNQIYANEAVHGVGALLFALTAFQLLEQLKASFLRSGEQSDPSDSSKAEDDAKNQERKRKERKSRERLQGTMVQSVILGLATVYGAVGVLSKSNFIWSCSMLVLAYCFGGMGGYMSGTYYIGMDSPLLFTLLGSVLIGAARQMRSYATTAPLASTTRIWGLLYSFISLWILSIWGYSNMNPSSHRPRYLSPRVRMFLWSTAFAVAAGGSIWHGLRYDDSTTKGFGLTFLGINLYTKYFEYFWGWSKPIFFAVLAGTLAVVGRYAEDVWNVHLTEYR